MSRLAPALFAAAVALTSAACSSQGDAPVRRCAHHDQCDTGYLCGPEGACLAAATCAVDADCCPGTDCFSGWCRPTAECDAQARPCAGLVDVCEAGRCVPRACVDDAGCSGATRCVAGRCLAGAPCGGACPAGAVCHVPSGRCLAAPSCAMTCDVGSVAVLPADVPVDPLTCDRYAWPCACADLPAVPHGRPGVDGVQVLVEGAPALVSYDPVYGDLVLTRFDATGGLASEVALAGVPATTPTAPVGGYRGGVAEPGPDVGRRPAVAPVPGTAGPALDVVYRDADRGALRYLRHDPLAGVTAVDVALPIEGDVGRWSCLTQVTAAGGEARPAGLAYVVADPLEAVSRLVRFEALASPPRSEADWQVSVVAETPLPPLADAPCGGACGLTEVCVRPPGQGDGCAATVSPSQAAGAACACGPHEVCARPPGAEGGAACLPRVYARYDADRPAFGEGAFVTCGVDPAGTLVAAWYDADRGRLLAGRAPLSAATAQVVDDGGEGGHDVGRHAALAVGPGGALTVVYRDETARALMIAEAPASGAAWTTAVVHADGRAVMDLGGWAALALDADGQPLVAYGDARGADLWLAARAASGCWGRARVLSDGVWAYPAVVSDGDGAWLSGLRFGFDAALMPTHRPRVQRAPVTECDPRR